MRRRLRSMMVVVALIALACGITAYVKKSLAFQDQAKEHKYAASIREDREANWVESANSLRSQAEDSRKRGIKSMEDFKASILDKLRRTDNKGAIAVGEKAIADAESRGLANLKAKEAEFSRDLAGYAILAKYEAQLAAYHRRMARRFRAASWRPWQGVQTEPIPPYPVGALRQPNFE